MEAYRRDLADLLHPQEIVVTGFITKGRSGDSTIPVHLDWAIVDETRDRSVNVWIPLCDTHAANGALAVLPGSQRLPVTRRGTDTPPALAAPPELLKERMVSAGTPLVHSIGDSELREVQVDAGFFHEYVVDPDSDRGPNVDALVAGRPSRPVPATRPITAADIRAIPR